MKLIFIVLNFLGFLIATGLAQNSPSQKLADHLNNAQLATKLIFYGHPNNTPGDLIGNIVAKQFSHDQKKLAILTFKLTPNPCLIITLVDLATSNGEPRVQSKTLLLYHSHLALTTNLQLKKQNIALQFSSNDQELVLVSDLQFDANSPPSYNSNLRQILRFDSQTLTPLKHYQLTLKGDPTAVHRIIYLAPQIVLVYTTTPAQTITLDILNLTNNHKIPLRFYSINLPILTSKYFHQTASYNSKNNTVVVLSVNRQRQLRVLVYDFNLDQTCVEVVQPLSQSLDLDNLEILDLNLADDNHISFKIAQNQRPDYISGTNIMQDQTYFEYHLQYNSQANLVQLTALNQFQQTNFKRDYIFNETKKASFVQNYLSFGSNFKIGLNYITETNHYGNAKPFLIESLWIIYHRPTPTNSNIAANRATTQTLEQPATTTLTVDQTLVTSAFNRLQIDFGFNGDIAISSPQLLKKLANDILLAAAVKTQLKKLSPSTRCALEKSLGIGLNTDGELKLLNARTFYLNELAWLIAGQCEALFQLK